MMKNLIAQCKELKENRTVLFHLIRQQLILRYRRTILGYVWTLLNPLLMMSVTAVVFATLFKQDLKTYTVFLFAGMIPWNCFNAIVTQSGSAFLQHESLIKKIYLPKIIFPLSISLGALVDSVLSFFALFLIITLIGGKFSLSLFFIPLAYFLLFIFSFGVALLVSIATVFFRDLQHIILIAMQALFFLTPVMYKSEALAGKVAGLAALNPVVPFIDLFRVPLYTGILPNMTIIINATLFALGSVFLGLFCLLMREKKIIFRL